jgi:hypothetical protein
MYYKEFIRNGETYLVKAEARESATVSYTIVYRFRIDLYQQEPGLFGLWKKWKIKKYVTIASKFNWEELNKFVEEYFT